MENSTIVKLLVLIAILAILGFNVFTFLGKGAKKATDAIKEGGKTAVDTATKTLDKTEEVLKKSVSNKRMEEEVKEQTAAEMQDSVNSVIQKRSNSEWCFVGEDRGFRSCIEVNSNDMCLSENIFPTKDICINPTLRG